MTYNSSKTGAQVDGAVTDVQAAKAAGATDTTTGRLLKVGDFGVGGRAPRPSINDVLTDSGFYWFSDNGPANTTSAVINIGVSGATAFQIAGRASIADTMWFRGVESGANTLWRELYHTGNTIVDGNGFIKEA